MHPRKSDSPADDRKKKDALSRLSAYLGFRTTHRKANTHAERPVKMLMREAERKARRRRHRHNRRHHKNLDHGILRSDAPIITNEAELAPSMQKTVETFIERKRTPVEHRRRDKHTETSKRSFWKNILAMPLFKRSPKAEDTKKEEMKIQKPENMEDSFLARVDISAQKAQEMAESIQEMESVINKKARIKEQEEKQLESLKQTEEKPAVPMSPAPIGKALEEVRAQKNMLASLLETLTELIRSLPKNISTLTKKNRNAPPPAKPDIAKDAKQATTSNLTDAVKTLSSSIAAAEKIADAVSGEVRVDSPATEGRFKPLTPKMMTEEKKKEEEPQAKKEEPKIETPAPIAKTEAPAQQAFAALTTPAAQMSATAPSAAAPSITPVPAKQKAEPAPAAMTDDKTLVVEGRGVKKVVPPAQEEKKGTTPVAFEPQGTGKIIPLSKAAQELETFSKVVVKTGPTQLETQKKDGLEESLLKSVDKKSVMNQDLGDLMRDLLKKSQANPEADKDKKKDEPVVVEEVETKIGQLAMLKVRRKNGFTEFMGALKYFGMGKERYAIVQNLSTMLNAGLPLIDALRTLQAEIRVKPAKKLVGRILEAVENGSPLWRAMDDQDFFTPHAIALIRIGEEAGDLAQNMEYLAAQQEKDNNLRQKVRMAMIYPAIVLTLMFIIVIGLGMFVLPNLIQVLFSLNVKLPLVTRIVIAFTNAFTTYGAVGIPSFLVGVAILTILAKYTALRVVTQWVTFRIPGIGKLAREATIARFGVILGSLLQAGVPLVESIKSLVEVTPTVAYRNFYKRLLDHISVGDSFAKSFATIPGSTAILPLSMQQLIITGERTGTLSKIMLKIAEIYEHQANDTAQKLPVILEPMLLLFIGALVGTIAFSIIIPIYSIVGNVTGH